LSFFRIFAALTTGFYVLPTLCHLQDNYFHTAYKTYNFNFFTPGAIELVQKSPDSVVVLFVILFCLSWFFFLIGLFSQVSCILMTVCCYYFYALNYFALGTLTWDILLVTLFLMCVTNYHGDYFSVDSLRRSDTNAFQKRRPYFLQRCLQMQIAFTYFYTGLIKITASGNWITGNPIYYLMNSPPQSSVKNFLLKEYMANHPALCYWMGILIVGIELSMPFLLWNRATRITAIYLGIVFHINLMLTLDVPSIFFFLFPPMLLLFIHPDHVLSWIEQKRRSNRETKRSQLIYDGHCQFCRASVRKLEIMDLFGTLEPVDYQTIPDIKGIHPDLTKSIAHSQLHLIEPDGTLYGGFSVFRRICFTHPMLYVTIPIVYFPGAGIIGPLVYRWIANNRYLFHFNKTCQSNACFIK